MWHSPWCIGMAHGLNADKVGDTPRSSGISGKYWHEPPRTSLFVRSYCQGRSVPLRRYCAGRNELLSSISAVVRQRTCGEAFRGRLSAYLSWSNRWMGKRARGSVKLLTRPACSVFTPDRVLFVFCLLASDARTRDAIGTKASENKSQDKGLSISRAVYGAERRLAAASAGVSHAMLILVRYGLV